MRQQMGGVTGWHCPRCGSPVGPSGSCTGCGGGGVPDGPDGQTAYNTFASKGGGLKGLLGRLLGRGARRGAAGDPPAGS
jgi:hypothetical protein